MRRQINETPAHEEMHFLTAEQVADLAEANTSRLRVLIYTAAYAGLRAGEIGALRVDRLNLLRGTLEVVASLWEGNGQHVIGPPKSGRHRTLTIPLLLVDMLGAHLPEYPSANRYVFTSSEGAMLRHRNFYDRHFKPAVNAAGLPGVLKFHDFGHTCAALLIANGRHMEEVKEYLGHSTIRVTSDRYGHLFPSAREALAGSLDATFAAASARTGTDSIRIPGSVTTLHTRLSDPERGR
jgi:integrase